ncbi:MAG: 30S ribosomal protein S16 [Gemmatimonadetes bacterium]|nr:30S ribosomal protein S16 [Gemmatimonadota bacterium]
MVKIRLTRRGNHKRPFYRVVVAEEQHRRDGRFIEIVGTYDPLAKPAAIEVKSESVLHWLSKGAQPTDTVRQILKKSGVWAHWRDVQAGKAQIGDLEGKMTGTIERTRGAKPSKKSAAKIAEAATVEAPVEAPAEEASAEEATEESAS